MTLGNGFRSFSLNSFTEEESDVLPPGYNVAGSTEPPGFRAEGGAPVEVRGFSGVLSPTDLRGAFFSTLGLPTSVPH